jgi:ABC-type antimicrobial peptide transport system permease subunit
MSAIVARTIAQPRMLTLLLTTFAGLAVVLAAVGVYGVTSGSICARTAELGIRVTLGATPSDVVRLVLRSGGISVAIGIVAGSAAAMAGVRYLSTVLYGVDAWNPAPVIDASALLAIVAFTAIAIPAIRAARLDPLTALRSN